MNKRIWFYILFLIVLITSTIWLAVLFFPEKEFKIIACDVGQGDAILAVYGKTQILFDGGPDNSVLDCLNENISFWDRKIEIIVLTHPQKDHYVGLIEVLKRYDVENFLTTELDSDSQDFRVLKKAVGGEGSAVHSAKSGMRMRLGLIYLDIVWPMEDFVSEKSSRVLSESSEESSKVLGTRTTDSDPNDFSIVANIRFKKFDALMTGDIGPGVTDEIIKTGLLKDVDYIKIPHHGSKNGITEELLDITNPEVAVISSGKNNPYGHPHEEALKILRDRDIKILRTDSGEDVVIEVR